MTTQNEPFGHLCLKRGYCDALAGTGQFDKTENFSEVADIDSAISLSIAADMSYTQIGSDRHL